MAIATTVEDNEEKGDQPVGQSRYFGYASLWSRLGAFVIDSFILLLIASFLIIAILASVGFDVAQKFLPKNPEEFAVILIPLLLYFGFLESSSSSATPGKIASGIKVTDLENHQISIARSMMRSFWKIALCPGIVVAAFGERKQALHDRLAGSLVMRRGESYFWLAFFMMLVPVTIVVAGVSYYVFSEINARMIARGVDQQVEYGIVKKAEEKSWQSVAQEQYEQFLQQIFEQATDDKTSSAGPFLIKIDQFFEDERDPKVWIKISSPEIPNLQSSGFTEVTIDHVISIDRKNIYNADSGFEDRLFRQLSFQKESGNLFAIRTVRLLPGAKNGDILGISGNINLRLPQGLEVVDFVANKTASNPEKRIGDEIELRFVDAIENKVKFRYKGKQELLLGAIGLNNAGQQIEVVKASISDFGDFYNVEYEFALPPSKVQVGLASSFLERNYPFTLGKEFKKVIKPKEE